MNKTQFNFQELDEFADILIENALKTSPKKIKKFLGNEGSKLVKRIRACAKQEVGEKTGNYHNAWKKSKVYITRGDDGYGFLAYNAAPHAHLIEDGHIQQTKTGEIFVKGKHVLEKTTKEFESTYYQDCEQLLDELAEGV